jgi:dipeptidyl aminopeptidase/acylaminoacyl peptidase
MNMVVKVHSSAARARMTPMRILPATAFTLLLTGAALGQLPTKEPVTLPEYASIPKIEQYASPDEYETARRDSRYELTRLAYDSDGLTVYAYHYAPRQPKGRLPVVVFNRGSYIWKQFAGEYLTLFHRLAEAGFLVIAPMYRGSGGAAGRDELGGADLADLLNVTKLIARLPNADPDQVFMYGESRGAMMTYQAIREKFPMRAAAVYGGFTNLAELAAPGGKFASAATMIWPDYAEHTPEIVRRRSALQWPDQFATPILIMHGGADSDVPPAQALALAMRLQELGKPYELIIRAGAHHVLTEWRTERDAHAIDWFRRHMTSR